MVSQKHLMIQAEIGGGIYFDPQINAMVSAMEPLTRIDRDSNAIQSALSIVSHLENTGRIQGVNNRTPENGENRLQA